MTNIIRWKKMNTKLLRRKDLKYGINKEGRMIVGNAEWHYASNLRTRIFYLGNVNKDFYYYQYKMIPCKRSVLFS